MLVGHAKAMYESVYSVLVRLASIVKRGWQGENGRAGRAATMRRGTCQQLDVLHVHDADIDACSGADRLAQACARVGECQPSLLQ